MVWTEHEAKAVLQRSVRLKSNYKNMKKGTIGVVVRVEFATADNQWVRYIDWYDTRQPQGAPADTFDFKEWERFIDLV